MVLVWLAETSWEPAFLNSARSHSSRCNAFSAALISKQVGEPDKSWLERVDTPGAEIRVLHDTYTPIPRGSGATAILAGGHLPVSLLLHWSKILFIADTIFTSPSATNPVPGKDGVISSTLWCSIANRVPLHPDEILRMWRVVKPYDFDTAFGAFRGQSCECGESYDGAGGGARYWRSQGQAAAEPQELPKRDGWSGHALLRETM